MGARKKGLVNRKSNDAGDSLRDLPAPGQTEDQVVGGSTAAPPPTAPLGEFNTLSNYSKTSHQNSLNTISNLKG